MSPRIELLAAVVVGAALGCATTSKVEPEPPGPTASVFEWSNVEALRTGTPVRVTERDGDKSYGRVMAVTNLRLTLELVDRSKAIERDEISLIERFPASFPTALPRAAVGVGAALTLSSSATPDDYLRTVVAGSETLEKASVPISNGYYVDATELVGRSIEWVDKAIESSRTTVVVYRR